MSGYDISALKAKQDEYDSRRERLLHQFIPFRDELIEKLEQFVAEAEEHGLRGVCLWKKKEDTDEILTMSFSLNDFDLVLLATTDALRLDLESLALASRILIYPEGSDDYTPDAEIVFQQEASKQCVYWVRYFTEDGPRSIRKESHVTDGAGRDAAEALIGHFYSFESVWKEKPALKMMLNRENRNKRAIGFHNQ
jgi:hypothetical protein